MSNRDFKADEINWEPVTGCTEISLGCDSCPSLEVAKKSFGKLGHVFEHGFGVRVWEDRLRVPLDATGRVKFFVCLGSDLFHDQVPDEFIIKVFEVMDLADQHTFEVCTKRAERLAYLAPRLKWPKNILMGVTVATKACTWRIDALRSVPAKYKYLSMCPLLEDPGKLNLKGIDHVGVVEESWGPKRPVKDRWVRNIKRQCKNQKVSFSFDSAVTYVDA
jgi:protein gp37